MNFTCNERRILHLTGVGHFGCHLAMLVYPTIAITLAREEGLPLEKVIGWSFWGYALFGLGALPVGLLADWWGARWVVRSGVLGLGPAMVAVALVEPGPMLVIALALVGCFASLYHPAGLSLISRSIEHRGRALGLNGICGNIGIASGPFLAELTSQGWGWRGAFMALGIFLLVLGVRVSFCPIEEPSRGQPSSRSLWGRSRERLKPFIILLFAITLGGFAYRTMTVAQPAYFAEKVDFIRYGMATSSIYLFGIIGQYLGGRLADRYDLPILYLFFHLLSLPFVLGMFFLSGFSLLSFAGIFIFFSLGMQPIENGLVAQLTPERWRSTGYGLKCTLVFGLGALSVRGLEVIMAHYSLAYAFLAVSGVVLLIVVTASLLAWKMHRIASLERSA